MRRRSPIPHQVACIPHCEPRAFSHVGKHCTREAEHSFARNRHDPFASSRRARRYDWRSGASDQLATTIRASQPKCQERGRADLSAPGRRNTGHDHLIEFDSWVVLRTPGLPASRFRGVQAALIVLSLAIALTFAVSAVTRPAQGSPRTKHARRARSSALNWCVLRGSIGACAMAVLHRPRPFGRGIERALQRHAAVVQGTEGHTKPA